MGTLVPTAPPNAVFISDTPNTLTEMFSKNGEEEIMRMWREAVAATTPAPPAVVVICSPEIEHILRRHNEIAALSRKGAVVVIDKHPAVGPTNPQRLLQDATRVVSAADVVGLKDTRADTHDLNDTYYLNSEARAWTPLYDSHAGPDLRDSDGVPPSEFRSLHPKTFPIPRNTRRFQ